MRFVKLHGIPVSPTVMTKLLPWSFAVFCGHAHWLCTKRLSTCFECRSTLPDDDFSLRGLAGWLAVSSQDRLGSSKIQRNSVPVMESPFGMKGMYLWLDPADSKRHRSCEVLQPAFDFLVVMKRACHGFHSITYPSLRISTNQKGFRLSETQIYNNNCWHSAQQIV